MVDSACACRDPIEGEYVDVGDLIGRSPGHALNGKIIAHYTTGLICSHLLNGKITTH